MGNLYKVEKLKETMIFQWLKYKREKTGANSSLHICSNNEDEASKLAQISN